jgi:hypothetical protein
VSGNSVESVGGGIANYGTLTLTHSTVSGNTGYQGGGIVNYSFGTLTLTHSTVSGNSAEYDGGGILNGGTLTLTDSTVSGNSVESVGGGIANDGGTLTLTDSTVSGNTAGQGGGIVNYSFGTLTLTHSTVSGNTAGASGGGGGIFNYGTLTLTNTLVDDDCFGETNDVSGGGNLESSGDTCGFDQPTDQVNVTAEQLALGPLQDNGGPTMTHALGAGSVAIDVIPEADCADADEQPLTTDQRGEPRPAGTTEPKKCDVGAFEVQLDD